MPWPPDNKYLRPNLEALARAQPEAARAVWAAAPPAANPDLEIFATPQGPVLGCQGRALASRIDPVKEAQGLARAWPRVERPLVFGWGSGYHLPVLSAYYDFMWVVEPRPSILRAALTLFDCRAWWPKIRLIAGRAGKQAPPWPDFLLAHAPTRRLNPEEYAYWQNWLSWPPAPELPALLKAWPELAAQAARQPAGPGPTGPADIFRRLPETAAGRGRLLLALLLLLNDSEL